VLLCLRGAGELTLEPLGELPGLLDGGASAVALLLGLSPHLLEHAPRLGQLAAELGDLRRGPGDLAARRLGLPARLLELSARTLQSALELLRAPERRLDGVGDLAGGRGRGAEIRVLLLRHGRRRRQLDQRAEGNDRPGGQVLVVETCLAAHSRVHPVDDGLVAALQLPQRVAARRRDLERLKEAVELEALAHPDRDEREGQLELGAVLPARDRLDHAAELGQLTRECERLNERPAEHARAGPAEQLLGRPAPARYGAVAIRQDEAGIDELTQQLLDCLRLGGRGTRLFG
jgi:hypothetical protein